MKLHELVETKYTGNRGITPKNDIDWLEDRASVILQKDGYTQARPQEMESLPDLVDAGDLNGIVQAIKNMRQANIQRSRDERDARSKKDKIGK